MASPAQSTESTNLEDLKRFLDGSPSPFHVVATVAARLDAAGFEPVPPDTVWDAVPEAGYTIRDATLIAWRIGADAGSSARMRIVGGHTDSPNLRITPHPDSARFNWDQLHVEPYGGTLNNSWLDRDLGVAGRVIAPDGSAVLFNESTPVARVPQLAVHLDRAVNEGLVLNPQEHLRPVWAIDGNAPHFSTWLAERSGLDEPVTWDLGLYDVQPAAVLGVDRSMLASGRLDNQVSCWAATLALIESTPHDAVSVVVLNDHEEVGSVSATGADGAWLEQVLERLSSARGLSRSQHLAGLASSVMVSADNAHAIHPNYPERSELRHAPRLNHGPVIKSNAKQRYATTAETARIFIAACQAAGVEHQYFTANNSIPCGSTIGPMVAARLGVDVVDVGVAQLSMHSAREMCGTEDPASLALVLTHILSV